MDLGDNVMERGPIPLDIDNVHLLLQVEQEQIQKRTFTNWVNAQLAKRRPPCSIVDLFYDFRDGSKLLDLLEVMSGQRMSRERGRGMFQHRSNIERALSFLKQKSIKLVNINIPDITSGKPSIILGLIWTIILQYHIEELAKSLSFDSRQSSIESLATLDTRSSLSSRSASSSPVPPRGSPLHARFRVSAKKALLLWVREQCHKAGCSVNVKDFKASWRSGVVFLAILYALRPDLVDLSKARTRSNKQNLDEAFSIAERELRIPRLLEADDVDVRDPEEKSIMTYVAQFLQYSRDLPAAEDDEQQTHFLSLPKSPSPVSLPVHFTPAVSASPLRQVTPERKVQEVTCWLVHAYEELLEGWDSTEGESYSERYHVFQTFLVSFNEQRRPIVPLLTSMRRSPKLSEEQRALREAWDSLIEKLREYRMALDISLPPPLDSVARWLLKAEGALSEEGGDIYNHGQAADEAREKQELLRVCLEEMPQQLKTFQSFQNMDEYGNVMVPTDKMEELKRRFTSVRVTAKYHGIKLEYSEHRHTVLDMLEQIRTKLRVWRRPFISPEAVRVLLQEWHELVDRQDLPSLLEAALHKLKKVSEKYSSKSALAGDCHQVSQQVKQLEEEAAVVLEEVTTSKATMGRVLSAWDSYTDCFSSVQAWLLQGSSAASSQRSEATPESIAEWSSRHVHLNETGNFLIKSTDPQTSRNLADELRKLNLHWEEFVQKNTLERMPQSVADIQPKAQDLQALIREATLVFKEPVEAVAGPLRTYRKRLQFLMMRIGEVNLDDLAPSRECTHDQLQNLKTAVPEVMQRLFEAEQVCAELQHSVSGLDSRLAELLHWETDARELYQMLRSTDRQRKQKDQDPRAKACISSGLQLEGQVVMEEQDLQVTVMSSQMSSPIEYLHATAMQDRVRAAVAQSQEAVGMLSSLGSRRDRSRSPPEASPPAKVFVQDKETPQPLTKAGEIFVPRIVVQDYRGEKAISPVSPTMPYSYAQAVIQSKPKSPPENQTQESFEAQEQRPVPQQQITLTAEKDVRQQQKDVKAEQTQEVQMPKETLTSQPQMDKQHHVVESVQTEIKETPNVSEKTSIQQPAEIRKPMNSEELQIRKNQAMKNRPWLQKPASGEVKGSAPDPEQVSPQDAVQTPQIQTPTGLNLGETVQGVSQDTPKARTHPETPVKMTQQTEQQEKDTLKFEKQPHPQKHRIQPEQQKGQKRVKPSIVAATQAQKPSLTATQTLSRGEGKAPMIHQATPEGTKSQSQSILTQQLQPQAQPQPVRFPVGPQPSVEQQSQAHGPAVAQVRALSPMQPLIPGQMQVPVPSHIQVRTHPQAWAPVRSPSPKPQTQAQPPTHGQPVVQAHKPSFGQSQMHPQSTAQIRATPQSMAYPQPQAQPMCRPSPTQPQTLYPTYPQQSIQPQDTLPPVSQYPSYVQPIQQPQGTAQPHLYPQGQSPSQQWMEKGQQLIVQQRPPMPQQQIGQSPNSQFYQQVQTPPQWAQQGPHVRPQGISPMGQVYNQPQIQPQPWNQMQAQKNQVQPQAWVQAPPQPYIPVQQQSPIHTGIPPQSQTPQQAQSQHPSRSKLQTQPLAPAQFQQPAPQTRQEPCPLTQPVPQVHGQAPIQPKAQPFFQKKSESVPQSKLQPRAQSPVKVEAQPKLQAQPKVQAQTPAQVQAQMPPLPQAQTTSQSKVQTPAQTGPQQTQNIQASQVLPQVESPDLCMTPPVLAQAPPQTYTEAYTKAQALARNGFEEAKHCLQAHILDAITVLKDKPATADQWLEKEETLTTLDAELLEEFLRAAKGMEAFCTTSQLRDMEFFTQSVTAQWEDVNTEISSYLQQRQFDVTRKHFNAAVLQCERHLSSGLESQSQACFSRDYSEAEYHLEALKELCDTLSPEDAHRLAQTQLRECEKRLAAIQRQFSGDQDAAISDSRISLAFSEDLSAQKYPTTSSTQVMVKPVIIEKKEAEKQHSVEEEPLRKEPLEKYEGSKKALQAQLLKNEQSIKDVPSESVSLKGLHTRLQEIQSLRQETESLWSDYTNQCSQLPGTGSVEQERAELKDQWRSQQDSLQRRGSSLGAALRQIDSTENHMVDFSERLDRYLRQPKDVTGFTLSNSNILRDIKELDDNIQSELDQLSLLDPESGDLDPREHLPLSREVQTHRTSLDQLREQVRKSEAAARALDRFLMSLRTVGEDISGVQGAPCSDPAVLHECRSKLSAIRQSIDSLKGKAPQLDVLLQGARLTVTRDGSPASCLDMVGALLRRLEEADSALANQQEGLKKESHSKSLGLRTRTMLGDLRKLQSAIESQLLREATIPSVQQRLRAMSELEGQLQAQHSEIQSLRDQQDKQEEVENISQELETEWKRTQKMFFERKKQFSTLLELLKKFQLCRSHLSNTIQNAEQTVSEQASYMGKDNLQRSMSKAQDLKDVLADLSNPMEELRSICKQLQSEIKKFPDCSETSYEAEAVTLMDNWLDVTEKTDGYMDNLRVALELWEKQLMLGGEVDAWAGVKLTLLAESHPFQNREQVLTMRDEILRNEENITHFHKKSEEIQRMLQSPEAPLELQVIETQLRKRMEQVNELFSDCTDVFEELVAVKKHIVEKIEECQAGVESIQGDIAKVDASRPDLEAQIQALCDDLEVQEDQSEAILKEVGMVSSVASPQALELLSADCGRLKDAITRTKDLIHLKREERDKGLFKVITEEKQSFEKWFQDLQVSVNECFENPETRADVETSVQRLAGFLKAKDAERHLEQLKERLNRGREQLSPQQLNEITEWQKEQQQELHTFQTLCINRQEEMQQLLTDLNRLHKQNSDFNWWLQEKEKQSVEAERGNELLKELQEESSKAESISELLASIRRRGMRSESLLKDGDTLIQRYRNLGARLEKQVEVQTFLEGEFQSFSTEAEETRAWIRDLTEPLAAPETTPEEMKSKALEILKSKPEGDEKIKKLRVKGESLCGQDDLQTSKKQQVQQRIRDTESVWRKALTAADEAVNKAEAKSALELELNAFKAETERVQTWIGEQDSSLSSMDVSTEGKERLESALAVLNCRFDAESKLRDLEQYCETLCENPGLDDIRRKEALGAVRSTEQQWRKVLQAAEEALDQAQREADGKKSIEDFKSQSETLQSWIREQKQKLLALGSHVPFEERMQGAQAVLASKPEGESRLNALKQSSASLLEDENKQPEVEQLLNATEQQWIKLLQAAQQAELRALSEDFHSQSKQTESWITEREQKMKSVGVHSAPEEKQAAAQAILALKPEGDCKVNNLRRRGQSVCNHPEAEENRKLEVQQTVKDTEEMWKSVMQEAQQADAAAGSEITQEAQRRALQLREFNELHADTESWLKDLQQQIDSAESQSEAEAKLTAVQNTLSSKSEGNAKLQKLKAQSQSLCSEELEEQQKQEVLQKVVDAEEKWLKVLEEAKQVVERAERQKSVEGQQRDFTEQSENTKAWLEEKQQRLDSVDSHRDPLEAINVAQEPPPETAEAVPPPAKSILSCKPEGDSRLSELRRRSEEMEESAYPEAEQAVKESEEQWKSVLQDAESSQQEAELQYSLHRELEALLSQAEETKAWVRNLKTQAVSMEGNTEGTRAQLEQRLNTAQSILSSKLNGTTRLTELRRRVESLSEQKELKEEKKEEIQQMLRDTEEEWKEVLQTAEDTHSRLQGVVDRLVSCEQERNQAETRLAELQKETSELPRIFSWPGLGERSLTVEKARSLMDQSAALAPVLSDIRAEAAELFKVTKDQNWAETSQTGTEETIPALIKELTEAVCDLEEGMTLERVCTQLVEQHEASQDWLREQVKGLKTPPSDRQELLNAVNTLKALLQTVDREQREMKELDLAKDRLQSVCSPGGRAALTLEAKHLHELCNVSEEELKQRLMACEQQLEEIEGRATCKVEEVKQRAAALQEELSSLDQALGCSHPQNNIAQLQQHWNSLQNCEEYLEDVGVKVNNLQQVVSSELPSEIISAVESLSQKHFSLTSRLSELQGSCSSNTERCLTDCLRALQQWNHSKLSEPIPSVQVQLEEGKKLQSCLQEALSYNQFLKSCLDPDVFDKLQKSCSETLGEAEALNSSLIQNLEVLTQKSEQCLLGDQESDASMMAPPRKIKRMSEKKPSNEQQQDISTPDNSAIINETSKAEKSAPNKVVSEETTPVSPRRKLKTAPTETESVQNIVESKNDSQKSEAAFVEETKVKAKRRKPKQGLESPTSSPTSNVTMKSVPESVQNKLELQEDQSVESKVDVSAAQPVNASTPAVTLQELKDSEKPNVKADSQKLVTDEKEAKVEAKSRKSKEGPISPISEATTRSSEVDSKEDTPVATHVQSAPVFSTETTPVTLSSKAETASVQNKVESKEDRKNQMNLVEKGLQKAQ
ncbi:nesprin-2 [Gouania willdenowi]|uniref:nesprin-2 n=1 Tax=Gouania willdenowi TaxID=441366 RepID=UPI0010554E73|nr:nesprin-2 [Gouania willdenowi]